MTRTRHGANLELPTVTVIGAGIAGLTAAHELVERGFTVQVVESAASDVEEYECRVGGLAANQFTRVRSPILDLHPWLRCDAANLCNVEAFRDKPLESTARRFPLLQTIRFDKCTHDPTGATGSPEPYDKVDPTPYEPKDPIPADWESYWDRHGSYNKTKLDDVLRTIRQASRTYLAMYFRPLSRRLERGPPIDDAEWVGGTLTRLTFDNPTHAEKVRRFVAREGFTVQIIGYTDGDGTAEGNRAIANLWAQWVKQALITRNGQPPYEQVWELDCRLEVIVQGGADPKYDQGTPLGRNLSNRVEFAIVEQVIPGEHGFRFFPAFYRNLFDTMRRTPVFNAEGEQTGTAFDQLVPTPQSSIALSRGQQPQEIDVKRVTSLFQLHEALKLLCQGLGFTMQDLVGLEFYMLRYLVSCVDRRVQDAETVTLLDYIGGDNPPARFSKAALAFLDEAPRALAAMSARESDARTQLDVTAQLLQLNMSSPAEADRTWNGPTTTAWLDHWKAYLKNQGVKFFVGEVVGLRQVSGRYLPRWSADDSTTFPTPEDPEDVFHAPKPDGSDLDGFRFVLALSYQGASKLVWSDYDGVNGAESPFRRIIQFDQQCGRRKTGDAQPNLPKRNPETGAEARGYPLRTISGAQFFFAEGYRFGYGDIYYPRAAWGLTSISQFAYWRNQIDPVGEYLGQLSVDIGDWHVFADRIDIPEPPGDHGEPAWYSSEREIGRNVWTQIKAGFEKEYSTVVQSPRYFHLDDNLVFATRAFGGYIGAAMLRIVEPGALHPLCAALAITPRTHFLPGSNLRPPPGSPDQTPGASSGMEAHEFADALNAKWKDTLAIARPGERDVMIVPRVWGDTILVSFRRPSQESFYLAINDAPVQEFKLEGPPFADVFAGKLPEGVEAKLVDDESQIFAFTAKTGFSLAVANADGAIEILNGPRLDIAVHSKAVRLVQTQISSSGESATGAVRANAIVRVPKRYHNVLSPFLPLHLYGIAIAIGSDRTDKTYPSFETDPTKVRDALYNQLDAQTETPVLIDKIDDNGIILSPISPLQTALIRVLAKSHNPFVVKIENTRIPISCSGLELSAARDKIVSEIEANASSYVSVEPIGDDSLELTSVATGPKHRPRRVAIGVLNIDRAIEIVGAPALAVKAYGLYLEHPKEGFVVLRNDAEFLINIPNQWGGRPGLLREPEAIPRKYRILAGDFGDRNPEIYYGSPQECPLFQYWTLAGTYMATYTRITTMEAANESGRHAAAAVIYQILASGQKGASGAPFGLVANFPYVWRIEDYEPPDLKFYKELDAALFARGLPNVLDILGITDLMNATLESTVGDPTILRSMLGALRRTAESPGLHSLATLRNALDKLVRG